MPMKWQMARQLVRGMRYHLEVVSISEAHPLPIDLKPHLIRCGYRADLIAEPYEYMDFDGGNSRVSLLAFADYPTDSRSACIALVRASDDTLADVRRAAPTGAAYVFAVADEGLEWWSSHHESPTLKERVGFNDLPGFFSANKEFIQPDRVFRAKTIGSFNTAEQLSFVDSGLMPLVEGEIGQQLSSLMSRVVSSMLTTLGRSSPSPKLAARVFKVAFWLLAGKMLRDKNVVRFKNLDLKDVEVVFDRVGRHYGTEEHPPRGSTWMRACQRAATQIDEFANLGNVSTESLGYLYESTLVPKPVRDALGIHSTPAYLIDYLVWNAADWLYELNPDRRHVFEPACGHGGFLVAAVRLLRELLGEVDLRERTQYLRRHIHGVEVDPFALEIARLSLTLADIPNPSGWKLHTDDMFLWPRLDREIERAGLVLANPPFADFSAEERREYQRFGVNLGRNKAADLLERVSSGLSPGSAFGFVMPLTFLHGRPFAKIRREMLLDIEIREICTFPDKVFSFGDSESVAILGRKRVGRVPSSARINYRIVREGDLDTFRSSYQASSEQKVPQRDLEVPPLFSLKVPDLLELWKVIEPLPRLVDYAHITQGVIFQSENLPAGVIPSAESRFPGARRGFDTVPREWLIHETPPKRWLNLSPEAVRFRGNADSNDPQVIMNYSPVSRGPWRIKAAIDHDGLPAKGRFISVRPRGTHMTVEVLWAILNSPVANAFVFCHGSKRDITSGLLKRLPIPSFGSASLTAIHRLVKRYHTLAEDTLYSAPREQARVRQTLLNIDAEVLGLYDLPPRLERQLLDLFAGYQRSGVPVPFMDYYEDGFDGHVSLGRLLSKEFSSSTAHALVSNRPSRIPESVRIALRAASRASREE